MSTMKNNPPLHVCRNGATAIKLWQQGSQEKPFITVSLEKTYKDPETGAFKTSRSFGEKDLLRLQSLIPQARQEMQRIQDRWREQRQEHTQTPQHQAQHDMHSPNLETMRTETVQRTAQPLCAPKRERGHEW